MKNLTISMDEQLYSEVRVDAAKAGKSMSKYISEVLRKVQKNEGGSAERRRRLEALQRVFDGPKLDISVNGKMPSADERNARR